MSWVWCSYIYSHFHKKGYFSLYYEKIVFAKKSGVVLGLKISDFGWKRGVFFRPKSAKKGDVFQTWVRAWYTLWSGVGWTGTSYWLLSLHVNQPSHSWDMAFSKFDLENPTITKFDLESPRSRSSQSPRSHSGWDIPLTHIRFISC